MNEISNGTWSETDASNNAATPNGWPEGQPPSSVNDCARMMMGAVRRFWGRINGAYATTGAANAYVLTPAAGLAGYVPGERYSFRASFANTGPATLDISALGAKAIRKYGGAGVAALAPGDIQSGQSVTVEYDGTDMILVTPVANSQDLAGVVANSRNVGSGAGLIGGGDLSADRTLAVGAGAGIVVNADDVAVDKATQAQMEGLTANKVATADNMKWHPGVAKAWTVFDGTGAGPSLPAAAAHAVSSITKNGTGDYTITWSTAFSSANYLPVVWGQRSNPADSPFINCNSIGVASMRLQARTSGGAPEDYPKIFVIAFGDQ